MNSDSAPTSPTERENPAQPLARIHKAAPFSEHPTGALVCRHCLSEIKSKEEEEGEDAQS